MVEMISEIKSVSEKKSTEIDGDSGENTRLYSRR